MKSSNELRTLLRSIDRKSYPAYKALSGAYQFGDYVLVIDHVQGDPFASPSSVHVEVSLKQAGFPEAYYQETCSRIALEDFLTRRFGSQVEAYNFKAGGSGKSGLLSTARCGQEVLERSACQIGAGKITARFHIDFRHLEELSMQADWKKYFLSIFLHVWKTVFFTGSWIRKRQRRQYIWRRIRKQCAIT